MKVRDNPYLQGGRLEGFAHIIHDTNMESNGSSKFIDFLPFVFIVSVDEGFCNVRTRLNLQIGNSEENFFRRYDYSCNVVLPW